MIWIFILLTICHLIFFIFLSLGWKIIPEVQSRSLSNIPVTIILPVRNEEDNILQVLRSIQFQEYDLNRVEVLIIDDHSEDHTIERASLELKKFEFKSKILKLPNDQIGKKAASTKGVVSATYNLILCTDADCLLPPKWIQNHVFHLQELDMKMVTGPVMMDDNSFYRKLQSIEFSGLIAYGAITLYNGFPGMCNGANMSYDRDAFLEVEGYKGNDLIPTGDDEFLLQKINKRYPGKVSFLKSKFAIVKTSAKAGILSLLQQRIRWTSKWKFHESNFIKMSAILGFIDFLFGALLLPGFVITGHLIYLILWLGRLISEALYLHFSGSFFGIRKSFPAIVVLSTIYPFYALFLGIASIFGKYSWKGRSYS